MEKGRILKSMYGLVVDGYPLRVSGAKLRVLMFIRLYLLGWYWWGELGSTLEKLLSAAIVSILTQPSLVSFSPVDGCRKESVGEIRQWGKRDRNKGENTDTDLKGSRWMDKLKMGNIQGIQSVLLFFSLSMFNMKEFSERGKDVCKSQQGVRAQVPAKTLSAAVLPAPLWLSSDSSSGCDLNF